jgi:ankyrin repeat protein
VDEYGGGNRTTPLTHAAMGGHVEAAVALRERGADASRRDADGFTASMHAGYRHPRDVALAAAVADAVADVEPK